MTSDDRMVGCICANGAKVAEIVHPYCPAHVPPEVEAELASLRAEVERLTRRLESTPPFPDCGGGMEPMNDEQMRALMLRWSTGPERYQADADALIGTARHWRAEVERLKSRPVGVPGEVRAAWSQVSRYVGHSGAHDDACDAADIVDAWLASLPAEVATTRTKTELDAWLADDEAPPVSVLVGASAYDGRELEDRPPPWQIDTEVEDV